MHLPPVTPLSDSDICVSGDVVIHPSAVIASGSILQAAPQCRIVIGAGACVGMGSILTACKGKIEVAAGAVLGAGVLMIGSGKIGKNASIGAATTIYNASIEEMAIITPGSIVGDNSRQFVIEVDAEPVPVEEPKQAVEKQEFKNGKSDNSKTNLANGQKSAVIGQVYINNMLYALFPERQKNSPN